MHQVPNRQEHLTGLFVVLGATIVFAPLIWLLNAWLEALARDPNSASWGAQWLGTQLSAHPYPILGVLFLGVALLGALVMLLLLRVAKQLAARLTHHGRSD